MEKKPIIEEHGKPMAAFLLMFHTSRRLKHKLNSCGGFGEMTPSQFYTLKALEHHEGLPLSEISECIHRSPGNMTLVIDNLEKNGWVERVRSKEDRRVVLVHLTKAGKEKILVTKKENRLEVEKVMSALNEEEINLLFNILDKLSSANLDPDEL